MKALQSTLCKQALKEGVRLLPNIGATVVIGGKTYLVKKVPKAQ